MSRRAGALAGVVMTALLVACGTAPPQAGSSAMSLTTAASSAAVRTTMPLTVGRNAWVAVSVATVWRSPTSPRPVDAPALARPVRIRQWLATMTLTQRRELSGRADTQALMGERVVVVGLQAGWARVVVPDQPSPKDARGYPGWVPARQLTARTSPTTPQVATVIRRTAWLRADSSAGSRVSEISFGTVLPLVGTADRSVRVVTPAGDVRRIRRAAVVVHPRGTPARAATPADLVSTAQLFTGLPYLWAGVSGFGLDCSGLTWLDYRIHGLVIPRDASAQAARGTRVAWSALRKGDLLFYATNGLVHHVTMYAGNGLMVQAPHTGSSVETTPTTLVEYAGARRYLLGG